MTSFADYTTTGSPDIPFAQKMQHLVHVEELPLDDPEFGFSRVYQFLQILRTPLGPGRNNLSAKVSVKMDGAPAVVVGRDANGFFVGTKSVLNKRTPKIAYTPDQIDTLYPGGLGDVLQVVRRALKSAVWEEGLVLQGDVLFARSVHDPTLQMIDGVAMLTFQPNTILYAVPVDSLVGRAVASASLGICFHTRYVGDTRAAWTPIPLEGPLPSFSSDVWVCPNTIRDVSTLTALTPQDVASYEIALQDASTYETYVNRVVWRKLVSQSSFVSMWKKYCNDQIRSSDAFDFDALIASLNLSADTATTLRAFLSWQECIALMKKLLLDKYTPFLNLRTFVPDGDGGLRVIPHEGLVVTQNDGTCVKLVDRWVFSKLNFLTPKQWQLR